MHAAAANVRYSPFGGLLDHQVEQQRQERSHRQSSVWRCTLQTQDNQGPSKLQGLAVEMDLKYDLTEQEDTEQTHEGAWLNVSTRGHPTSSSQQYAQLAELVSGARGTNAGADRN